MAAPAVLTVADTIARSFLLAVETRGENLELLSEKTMRPIARQRAA